MVEVTRSGEIESFHQGVAVLINSSGNILKEWGNSDLNIYPRSALKPIQTLNLYKDGLAEDMNLTEEQIRTLPPEHRQTLILIRQQYGGQRPPPAHQPQYGQY